MKINRTNYETFIIDYLDGNLSNDLQKELHTFLNNNLDIKEEFEGLNQIQLNNEPIIFKNKNLLKKEIQSPIDGINEFDYLCIANLEGDLSNIEQAEFQTQISNDKIKQQINKLYSQTILNPDKNIEFLHKNLLKKNIVSQIEGINDFDYLCIANLEGDLSQVEQTDFQNQISTDKTKKQTHQLYSKTKLKVDSTIEFPYKQLLKKRTISLKPVFYYSISSVAAMFILFLGLKWNYFSESYNNGTLASNMSNVLASNPNNLAKKSIKQVMGRNYKLQTPATIDKSKNQAQKPNKKNNQIQKTEKVNEKSIKIPDYEQEIKLYNEIEELNTNPTELTNTSEEKKYAKNTINKNEISKSVEASKSQSKFWNFVKTGVGNVKSLTGADIDVKHEADKNGKTKKFAVNLGKFSISHSKSK